MLSDYIIMSIDSPFASPVEFFRNNNCKSSYDPKAWEVKINYQKLNVITQYPEFPIPITDVVLATIVRR